MMRDCGKARNYYALCRLVEPVKANNRQKVQILSFHPKSTCEVVSATWRMKGLSRMLSPCFLVGAPFQHGRMRLTEPRGFRVLRCWVCLFYRVLLLFVYSFIRCAFVIVFKETSYYIYDYFVEIRYEITVFVLWFIFPHEPVTSQLYAAKVVFSSVEKRQR